MKVTGSCLCGSVCYEAEGPFKTFQYCHCQRCRKVTGSAHAANIFVPPERFRFTKNSELVGRFEEPNAKYFATSFCKQCGSSLPWHVQGGVNVVIPAGSLDDDPGIRPMQNIFWDSRAPWYDDVCELKKFSEFPRKSSSD
jgi:hypothetical protein